MILAIRTISAVPNNPPNVETAVAVATSLALSRMRFLFSYILTDNESTAGPSKNRKMSPAPVPNNPLIPFPILYVVNIFVKLPPSTHFANNPMMAQVCNVQVTSGWTTFLNPADILDPYAKLARVVEPSNMLINGTSNFGSCIFVVNGKTGDAASRATTPLAMAVIRSCFISSSEKTFGAGDGEVLSSSSLVDSGSAAVVTLSLDFDDEDPTFMTDPAVVKRVKKNPPTMTAKIFAISIGPPISLPSIRRSVINDGTKKTGSHFANNPAPGANTL
mmetsp:Transcript_29399/g.70922  ORF Transcript_29399/g.70922 Transcript_29399/m.70922 type:complete len:275 (-) Transcript_29399:772-1596(-)